MNDSSFFCSGHVEVKFDFFTGYRAFFLIYDLSFVLLMLLLTSLCRLYFLQFIEMEKMALESRWAPTIVAILLEATKAPRESLWYPYLRMFFHQSNLDVPLFWDRATQQRLLGTSTVPQRITGDRQRMETDVDKHIVPLLRKLHRFQENELESLRETVVKISGFIMAYSFTRPDSEDSASTVDKENSDSEDEDREASQVGNALMEVPIMVPIADFLNASVRRNNARLHWDDDGEVLKMLAVKNIKAGEEIFNTYGEISSSELLYLYGYAEDDEENPFEEVFIPSSLLRDTLTDLLQQNPPRLPLSPAQLDKRWSYLEKKELVGEKYPIVIGKKEILTDMEVSRIMEVLTADAQAFADMDAAGEDEEEEADFSREQYRLENLSKLDPVAKDIFARVIQKKLNEYPRTLPEERKNIEHIQELLSRQKSAGNVDADTQRSLFIAFVHRAELVLLNEYLRCLNS
ncbi:N-lysine methyltransferase setd6-like isoform X2 [Paramacrobiotus metropolitanus]|uniref:N-lysine methyltransferase setd6-like isoform X2 n=1 Tax=Paramacrobiotus metropolitanus TaxID=2943436 RepID=UPI002445B307|nr:N-lysine methyltransferase setd6-like isoform X2 [Paramacrobiotus metropolitanus]